MAVVLFSFDRDDEGQELSNEALVKRLEVLYLATDVTVYPYAEPEGRHAYPPFRKKKLADHAE